MTAVAADTTSTSDDTGAALPVSRARAWLLRVAAGVGVALMLLGLLTFAGAQDGAAGWAVQTVALRDLREAERAATRLRFAGFPAFTEFAMADGLQFVRVRVGCWTSRDAAVGIAALLLEGHVREAVVVPHDPASERACVDVDVGFLTPASWTALHDVGHKPTFRVELAGHVGHLRHDGVRWQVLQGDGEPEPLATSALSWRYRSGEIAGGPVVFDESDGVPVVLCPGRLIGQVADVVIVVWEDAVVACRPPAGTAP